MAQGNSEVDEKALRAHPIPRSALVESQQFGKSLWGKTGKLTVKLPDATLEDYFLKMCHGESGEAFIFDACSFHRHNEHDTGNWRAPRHNLSGKAHIENYELHFPVSEPVEDWDARNQLYSLPYNLGNAIYVSGSSQ
ncbi:hypothetical protein QC762_0040250 [Podospora pseudocomata]|uniref:Uncharacterized protein n=1 Tax=Podospora pseudocomata TaxID=2093779 RepID=A0ABR0GMC3_9PEZI|nr:hypothetical protein QC762_0040250 [Podospora pseudocomata]